MPGIAGLLVKEKTGKEDKMIKVMVDSLCHESFYTNGFYMNPELGFYIGYTAIRNSFADCMPIYNEAKDLILFFTGECFFDQKSIRDLKNKGHAFNPDDGSYLIHFYEEEGDKLFGFLNGWYNGIILDLKKSKAILFNDRCGIRRIYYYEDNNLFAFSSEAKSLLKVFPMLRSISMQSMAEFLNFDCVLDNKTYFSDIFLLPAGSAWNIHKGSIEKKSSIDRALFENQKPLPKDQFLEELGDTFKRILPRYFTGGPVALSLTGGLDTRSILACYNPAPGQLPCYTFSGTFKDIMDVRLAPKVAKIGGQSHEVLRFDDEILLKGYPSHVEKAIFISDGLEGVNKADVISFNKLAREIAPVRMTGKYGSQVLKGIIGFQERRPQQSIINPDFLPEMDNARENGVRLQTGHPLSFLLTSVTPWWWNGFVTLESSQLEVRSPFLDNDLINLLYRIPKDIGNFGTDFQLNLIRKVKPELMAIPTTGSYGGNYWGGISSLIKFVIKSLLILDKIHIREELPYKMTHIFARIDSKILTPFHMDRLIMGFAEFRRYRIWFRDQLAGYLQDVLLNPKTLERPYWNRQNLTKIVNDHIRGRGTYLREIRKALQIELVHRILLEKI